MRWIICQSSKLTLKIIAYIGIVVVAVAAEEPKTHSLCKGCGLEEVVLLFGY